MTLYLFSLFAPFEDAQQDPRFLLATTDTICNEVRSGKFDLISFFKSIGDEELTKSRMKCVFSKVPTDTVFGAYFELEKYVYQYVTKYVYSDEGLLTTSKDTAKRDKKWTHIDSEKYPKKFNSIRESLELFSPIFDHRWNRSFIDDMYEDDSVSLLYLGIDSCNGFKCHLVSTQQKNVKTNDPNLKIIDWVDTVWVDDFTQIPIKHTSRLNVMLYGVSDFQYKSDELINFNFESDSTDTEIENALIVKDIVEFNPLFHQPNEAKLIKTGEIGFQLALKQLMGDTIDLTQRQEKLIVLDFFYRSCYPCLKAMPALQSIYEHYLDSGVVVIGVNPVDEDEESVYQFMRNRGFTYPLALTDRNSADYYGVSAFPTIVVMNQDLQVVYTHVGYSDQLEEELAEVIEKNLQMHH